MPMHTSTPVTPTTPITLCPLITQDVVRHSAPDGAPARPRARLAYSFTVPGDPRSAAVARHTVRSALYGHDLAVFVDPALQVITELVTCGALFAPGQDLYYSLRWREGILRLVNWDPHSSHSDPVHAAHCTSSRKRLLLLLACVVRECGGTWGITDPTPTTEGTKVWADLPETGAKTYGKRHC
ncbi:ATP-binding protein [Streptomyces sp. HU2014]|uniref:ATP-binding protein n=1 Tax=Streptomyces sp. HU2014 TaxID=2939414 RepID=UPI00200F1759|nr:ATP-binding protein [Streptomyces sp. HU2014]UQI48256.1 ATP-binding protein [Streptomyces sp. HU2014]